MLGPLGDEAGAADDGAVGPDCGCGAAGEVMAGAVGGVTGPAATAIGGATGGGVTARGVVIRGVNAATLTIDATS